MHYVFQVFIGLSSGIIIGASYVALLVIFDLIPRLAQVAKAYHRSKHFELALVAGAFGFSFLDMLNVQFAFPIIATQLIGGIFNGIFVGMLAAALAEVMNVLPIIAKRLKLVQSLSSLMLAMVCGKVVASLVDWLFIQ